MLLARCIIAGSRTAWIVQNEGIAKAVLLDADAAALLVRAAMVYHLLMMLWHRVVLQLLELVAGWHVSELLATVVVQDGSGRLLVVAWPVAHDHGVCGWHRHRAHTYWDDVRCP